MSKDQDQEVTFNRNWLGFMSLILIIVSSVVSVTAFSYTIKAKQDAMDSDLSEQRDNLKEMYAREMKIEKEVEVLKSQMSSMQSSLNEMKSDIKDIKKATVGG